MISVAVLGHLAKENYMVNPSSLGLLLWGVSHGFQGENRYLAHSRAAVIRPWNGENLQGPWVPVQHLKLPLSACQVAERDLHSPKLLLGWWGRWETAEICWGWGQTGQDIAWSRVRYCNTWSCPKKRCWKGICLLPLLTANSSILITKKTPCTAPLKWRPSTGCRIWRSEKKILVTDVPSQRASPLDTEQVTKRKHWA